MIALDWGTSNLRASLLGDGGVVLESRAAAGGVMAVPERRFAEALNALCGDWIDRHACPVIASGMVGSRQGWQEAPYVACPAGPEDIARRLIEVGWGSGRRAWIAPGLSSRDTAGVPDVMRGEETQILGVLDRLPESAWVCLPGTHSKWVEVREHRIARFTTHMTGEVFAVMKAHSILGRLFAGSATDLTGFDAGVQRARDPGGLLHHLFGVRARGLFGELADVSAASYLSGLLIGHELLSISGAHAAQVYLLGSPELTQLYQRALEQLDRSSVTLDADAVVGGLSRLAQDLPEE